MPDLPLGRKFHFVVLSSHRYVCMSPTLGPVVTVGPVFGAELFAISGQGSCIRVAPPTVLTSSQTRRDRRYSTRRRKLQVFLRNPERDVPENRDACTRR